MSSKLSIGELNRVVALLEELTPLSAEEQLSRIETLRQENAAIANELAALLNMSEYLASFLESPPTSLMEKAVLLSSNEEKNTLKEGDLLGEYKIKGMLGKGGFGTVYLAEHIPLAREVALKVSKNAGREALTLAQLEHDHIVHVFSESVSTQRQLRWVSMQYIPGLNLEQLMEKLKGEGKKLTGKNILGVIDANVTSKVSFDPIQADVRKLFAELDEVDAILWIGCKLLEALSYAHSRGILHLDVKPSNILLNQYGRPYLTDFNISLDQQLDAAANVSNFGGTWEYMAPEQEIVFHSKEKKKAITFIDHRADIYSLGIVLRELLDGTQTTDKVELILDVATQKEASERFESSELFLDHLKAATELKTIEAKLPELGLVGRFAKKHPLVAITLVGAVPQIVASLVAITYNFTRIVPQLTAEQKNIFISLNQSVTPAFYPIASIFWIILCYRLTPHLKNPKEFFFNDFEKNRFRQRALKIPLWGAVVTTFCWFLTSVLFPVEIHQSGGPLPAKIVIHLFCSFLLSSLIALSYTFLLHLYLTLRTLYPRFLISSVQIRETAKEELKTLGGWLKLCLAMILFIPNLAAVILLALGSSDLAGSSNATFRILSVSLICFGIAGLLFALSTGQKIVGMILAFTRK